jgi:energy-coupling factor transporter ATP-binding protein EcfA2
MATHVRICKFDPENIKKHRIVLAVGRRGSGKSSLLMDMLYNLHERYDYCLAMCPTMESAGMLRECMPESCVYNRFSQAKLETLVQTARELAGAGKEKNFLLVLDDVLYDKSICRSQAFRFLFLNGRHVRISVFITAQYVIDMPPDLRSNVDYVFSMKEPMLGNRVKLHRNFFGILSFDDFCAILDRTTQNHECICLDNTSATTSVNDCIFWYKAKQNCPKFSIGLKVFYNLEDRFKRPEGSPGPSAQEQEAQAVSAKKVKLTIVKEEDGDAVDDAER